MMENTKKIAKDIVSKVKLLAGIKGYVSYDDLNLALPYDDASEDLINAVMEQLSKQGVSVKDETNDDYAEVLLKLEAIELPTPLDDHQKKLVTQVADELLDSQYISNDDHSQLSSVPANERLNGVLVKEASKLWTQFEEGLEEGKIMTNSDLALVGKVGAQFNFLSAKALAMSGASDAMKTVADYFNFGLHTEEDPKEASIWYGKAIKAGCVSAAIPLAKLYWDGRLPKADVGRVRDLLNLAADQGEWEALEMLASLERE
jgi:uncharacterized glyoxalase superfamily protein PhnB